MRFNPILEGLPNTIGEKQLEINTDFKLFLQLLSYSKSNDKIKVFECVQKIVKSAVNQNNIETIIEDLTKFMNLCDIDVKSNDKPSFDFDFDGDVIYSDFKRIYNIDLSSASMHWLEFKLLINNLPENSATEKRRQLRQMKTKNVANEDKAKLLQMQKALEIPSKETAERKEAVSILKMLRGEKNS